MKLDCGPKRTPSSIKRFGRKSMRPSGMWSTRRELKMMITVISKYPSLSMVSEIKEVVLCPYRIVKRR